MELIKRKQVNGHICDLVKLQSGYWLSVTESGRIVKRQNLGQCLEEACKDFLGECQLVELEDIGCGV